AWAEPPRRCLRQKQPRRLRRRAPVFTSALLGAPKKPAKRKRAKPPTASSGRNREAAQAAQSRRCLRQKQPRRSRGRRPNLQAGRAPRRKFGQRQPGAALRFLQAPSWARRKNRLSARGQSRRGAACGRNSRGGSGCAVEALPAAETAETEQGPPSKFASGPRPAPEIWATATRSRAPVFASALLGAPEKPAKRKRAKPPTARSVPCRQTACSRISSGPDGWERVQGPAAERGCFCVRANRRSCPAVKSRPPEAAGGALRM